MVSSKERPLANKRILVPPARPEANPLLDILKRQGAEAFEFPALEVAAPPDYSSMDRVVLNLKDFDFIVFSGSNCVINFFKRLEVLKLGKAALEAPKIVAIGHGAVSALKKESVDIYYVPKVHTAEGVAGGFWDIAGTALLLVRVEGASRKLPERLRQMGAEITEVAGYRMLVHATEEMAEKAFGRKLDVLALANPTSLRFFLQGAKDVGLDVAKTLKEVIIAAVGPATAEASEKHGLAPHIISKGHIADLAESLTHYFGEV
jgi:uroporphyrinogen III methyltransferase/synthase